MSRWLVLFAALSQLTCSAAGLRTVGTPVSWSITRSDSPKGRAIPVCQFGLAEPCVLARTTEERPSYATFVLPVWGPARTRFTGSVVVGYLYDPDPRHYKTAVDLISDGREVHQRLFSRVSTVPGDYTVRIDLVESREGQPPREHSLVVPVAVQ
jgi:hypothetical protein